MKIGYPFLPGFNKIMRGATTNFLYQSSELMNMSMYAIGVIINCAAVLLILGSWIYDTYHVKSGHEDYFYINLIGVGLVFAVVLSIYLQYIGKVTEAVVLVWMSALPVLITGFFLIILFLVDRQD